MWNFVVIFFTIFILERYDVHCTLNADSGKHPIILVPGDGGSQAYGRLKGVKDIPFPLWVNLKYFLAPSYLEKYFSIIYDPKTHKSSDPDLIEIFFPGWGDTWAIENLDSTRHSQTVYFEYLVTALKNDPFFIPNKTIRGTPFDFRKASNENLEFNPKLKNLIEETFENAGNRSVVLLGHSLGSLYSLAFLNFVSDSWKKTYIKAFLSVAGPLGGSVKALKIEASGDNFGLFLRSPLSFRPVQRSLPTTAFLLPDQRLWPPDEIIIVTPERNYSAHDYQQFFEDIKFPLGYQMMLDTKASVDGFVGPTGVSEVYCIHGANISTTYQMIYAPPSIFHSAFPDQVPTLVSGNGDGTVHLRSLEICRYWPGTKYMVLPGAEHLQIVGDPRFIEIIRSIVNADPKPAT